MSNGNRGILLLAFGEEFDKLTAAAACYSRRFTNLPICVITNLEECNSKWQRVSNVCFKYIQLPSNRNRSIKVSLIDYTPYDETLFMDSDAVIQKHGVETLFDYLKDFDIACQFFGVIQHFDDKNFEKAFVIRTYDKLAKLLYEPYPIELFAEAALLFRKTETSKRFFDLWKRYWQMMGCGRDMPGFCFAVKHMKSKVRIFRDDICFSTNKEDETFFIQHKGFDGFERKFGLPNYGDWNPKL